MIRSIQHHLETNIQELKELTSFYENFILFQKSGATRLTSISYIGV